MSVAAETDRARGRVLIVEDDPDIASLLAHALGKAGFTARTQLAGADALALIRRDPPALRYGTRTVGVHVHRMSEKLPSLTRALTVNRYGYRLAEEPS